ncbi:MAG TPA: hypothetical protein VEX13_17450, partial [Chloroflexia bacterium]|nr:hypothetical protein [Chloroflexia bacterium]
ESSSMPAQSSRICRSNGDRRNVAQSVSRAGGEVPASSNPGPALSLLVASWPGPVDESRPLSA